MNASPSAHRSRAAVQQQSRPVNGPRVIDSPQSKDGRPLYLDVAVAAQTQKDIGQCRSADAVGARQQLDRPGCGLRAQDRIFLVSDRLHVRQPISQRQARVQLLLQAHHLALGSFQVVGQAVGPARLISKAFFLPTLVGPILAMLPPYRPARDIEAERLTGHLEQRVGGGPPQHRAVAGELIEQHYGS